jgi:DNA-binding MarR family transcriptional regulator
MVTKMSNTTRLVDKLILKGYVHRITCESNRRKVEISITEEGERALMQMDNAMKETEKKIVRRFSTEELLELNILLDKF